MSGTDYETVLALLEGSLTIQDGKVEVKDPALLRTTIYRLAEVSAVGAEAQAAWARVITRLAALHLGIIPSSIHDLYAARQRGEIPLNFTIPAFNLRALPFDAARVIFHLALHMDAGAFIIELARSEIMYTAQSPAEYATSVLAAAIAEGYSGPVFLQGDHYQVSTRQYALDPEAEMQDLCDLTREALSEGYYNFDFDASTLVDVKEPELARQEALNARLTARLTAHARSMEPQGITVSVGGEIDEIPHNSTEGELRAFLDEFNTELRKLLPAAIGLDKVGIQTGTRTGGTVLTDGTIAQVDVDFDAITRLSRVGRKAYQLAGTVQHGTSTLPETSFGKFVESEALEVHLATNFQNILFARLPVDLRDEMYTWLDSNCVDLRQPGMSDEQFYYTTRKYALGPFKPKLWSLPAIKRTEIVNAWLDQIRKLFVFLRMRGTCAYVTKCIKPVAVVPELPSAH